MSKPDLSSDSMRGYERGSAVFNPGPVAFEAAVSATVTPAHDVYSESMRCFSSTGPVRAP